MLRRAQLLTTGSVLALGLVVSGTYLVNAATTSTTTITACSKNKTGGVRIVAPSAKCAKNEKRLTWNVKGATGARGLAGVPGALGAQGAAGRDGVDGAVGAAGQDGLDGIDGLDGADGQDGAQGPAGPAGPAGSIDAVNPNPNDLTYRMKIGTEPAVQIAGFTQEVTNAGTVRTGGGGGAGKPSFGDITATLPMNSRIVTQLDALARGTRIPQATFEMCQPGEATGHCTLDLSLTTVIVAGIKVRQDATGATVEVTLNFAKEKVSVLPGTADSVSYEWDIAENRAGSSSGTALPGVPRVNDTTYVTQFDTGRGTARVATRTWSQSSSQSGSTHVTIGAGTGKSAFSDVVAETRTGLGTVVLFTAMVNGSQLQRVAITGCESPTCASSIELKPALVTSLTLGSPTLYDEVRFDYGTVRWDRNDAAGEVPTQNRSFLWNVSEGATS